MGAIAPTMQTPDPPMRRRALVLVELAVSFALGTVAAFWLLAVTDTSNVWYVDGMTQHFPALYYFNELVRGFLREPGAGIPLWSWSLGLGADVPTTLHFYVLGDPFALVSLLFPMRSMELAYAVTYVLRLFLAQCAAYLYVRRMGARELPAILGSVVYVFTTYTLFSALRHPFFATAMVLLPLLLIGVERELVHRKPLVLVAAVCVSAFANFYFFYQLSLLTVIYAIARYLETVPRGERFRSLRTSGARLAGFYLLGTSLAAIALAPMLAAAFGSTRAVMSNLPAIVSSFEEYGSYVVALTSSQIPAHSAFQGYSIVAVMLLPALFVGHRSNVAVKFMVALYPVLLLTPWFGYAFNGFLFPSYRFLFSWGLFIGTAAALVLSDDAPLSRRQLGWMAASLAVYSAVLLQAGRYASTLVKAQLAVGAAALGVLTVEHLVARRTGSRRSSAGHPTWALSILFALVLLTVGINAFARYSPRYADELSQYEPAGTVLRQYETNQGMLARTLPEEGFYRVDKQRHVFGPSRSTVPSNDALVQDHRGVSFYFSIMSEHLLEYLQSLSNRSMFMPHSFRGFDDRAVPLSLWNVDYYLAEKGAEHHVPYGFVAERTQGESVVYRNAHALPMGVVYTRVIPRAHWDSLDPLQKQQALLEGAVVEDPDTTRLTQVRPTPRIEEVPYTVHPQSPIEFDGDAGRIDATGADRRVELTASPVADAELYLSLEGVSYDRPEEPPIHKSGVLASLRSFLRSLGGTRSAPLERLGISYGISGRAGKTAPWRPSDSAYFWGVDGHLVNLGYQPKGAESLWIRPQQPGIVEFERLRVRAVPMRDYADRLGALRRNGMSDVRVGTDRLRGTVRTSSRGVLYLSIPYSRGWSATLDGRPVPLMRVNTAFIGLLVPQGTSTLELRYRTPGLALGAAISLTALALACVLAIRARRHGRVPV